VKLLEGGGERAELELIAREVRTLLEGSMEPGEIAVVLRGPGGAADLIEEVFGAAKIPYALQRKRPLANTAIGRGLIGLLRCVPAGGGGAAPGGVGDLLAWLRAPGLLERPELADRLEAKARRTGCSSAAQARALWEGEYWRLETIDRLRVAAEHGARALIELARGELEWLLTASERGEASVLEREASVLESYEQDEAQALEAGRRALAELNELARIAPKLAPGDAAELARVLEGVEFVSGEGPTPGRVAVLDPLALRARRVRALFLCGLQEGEFPAPARPRPMLGEEERRRLAEISGLWLGEREDALAAERYLLYAAVSRPEELLVLSWHTADDDGAPVAKSLFVDDVCDLFDESLSEQRVRRPLGAVDWPEFGDPVPLRPYGEDARLEPEDERAPSGRGDLVPASVGVLAPLRDEELLREMQAHTWSASSLELWMSCPVRWLVERMLRAKDLNPDPEPIARGGLAHAALKDTLEGLKLETGSARLTPARLARGRELLKRALHQNEAKFPLSTRLERRPGVRRRLEVDLERYLEHAAAADSPLEPSYLELGFGFASDDEKGEGSALEAFDLGGGVMLRGRVDRIDVGAGGEAVVYDYKGRDAPPAAKWGAQGNVQIALYMRAVEGLLGLKAAGGFYQPLAGGDLRARGVLDSDSDVEIECVRGDKREGVEVQELLEEALVVARAVAAQAGRGELEARPETCAFRGGCMYPTICRCER
jgi:PD-(D/E)XK nuclease superfamily